MHRFHKLILVAVVAAIGLVLATFLGKREMAPTLALQDLQGHPADLAQWRGKVVLVTFWASTCRPCADQLAELAALQRSYGGAGLETLAIAMEYDHPTQVANYAYKNNLPFTIAQDTRGEAARRFGDWVSPPALFVVDRRGHLARRLQGEVDFGRLRALVAKLLAESP